MAKSKAQEEEDKLTAKRQEFAKKFGDVSEYDTSITTDVKIKKEPKSKVDPKREYIKLR